MELDKGIQDNAIRSLAEYIASPGFQRHFEQFFLDHALTFTDDSEHRLDYMEIYLRFQDMFNQRMEDFLASVHISEEEFGQRCQKVIKSDPKAEQYLEIVVASMDYDAFYKLMKAMRSRASLDRVKADAKASDEDLDDDTKVGDERGSDGVKRQMSNKRIRDGEIMSDSKHGDESLDASKLDIRDETKHIGEREAKDGGDDKESEKELK